MQVFTERELVKEIERLFALTKGDLSALKDKALEAKALQGSAFSGTEHYDVEDDGVKFKLHRFLPIAEARYPVQWNITEVAEVKGNYLPHIHKKATGKFIILQGEGALCLNETYYKYKPGSKFAVPNMVPHCFTTNPATGTTVFITAQDQPIKNAETGHLDFFKKSVHLVEDMPDDVQGWYRTNVVNGDHPDPRRDTRLSLIGEIMGCVPSSKTPLKLKHLNGGQLFMEIIERAAATVGFHNVEAANKAEAGSASYRYPHTTPPRTDASLRELMKLGQTDVRHPAFAQFCEPMLKDTKLVSEQALARAVIDNYKAKLPQLRQVSSIWPLPTAKAVDAVIAHAMVSRTSNGLPTDQRIPLPGAGARALARE